MNCVTCNFPAGISTWIQVRHLPQRHITAALHPEFYDFALHHRNERAALTKKGHCLIVMPYWAMAMADIDSNRLGAFWTSAIFAFFDSSSQINDWPRAESRLDIALPTPRAGAAPDSSLTCGMSMMLGRLE